MRAAQLALGCAAWIWTAALLLAPGLLRPVGGFICHQRPERSFFVGGTQLPVCARCTGLYVGAALAAPVVFSRRSSASRRARRVLAIAALPTAVTWTLEVSGAATFSNTARFIAGLPLGLAAAWLVLTVIADD